MSNTVFLGNGPGFADQDAISLLVSSLINFRRDSNHNLPKLHKPNSMSHAYQTRTHTATPDLLNVIPSLLHIRPVLY